MRVLLTGTGAADGIPGFFSDSRVSGQARALGGKDVRLRAGALIDGRLKIDFGPDTFAQCCLLGLRPAEWEHIVFTHSHDDHFAPRELQYLFPPFAPLEAPKPVVYGNDAVLDGFAGAFEHVSDLPVRLLRSFEAAKVGPYEVTPVRAYHKLDEESLNLIVRREGKTVLYAVDTGVYQEETWAFLDGWRFDAAVIECTDGFNPADYWGHLSCEELVSVVGRLRDMGCLADGSRVYTTHHSHSGMATHAELAEFFSPHGIEPGYDSLAFEA